MDGDEELSAAVIGGLDSLLQVCFIGRGFVHCGVVDGVPELLQFGDEGVDNGSIDFALSEAFIFGSVSCACCRMPRVDGNSYNKHLPSLLVGSKYKRK